MIGGKLQIALLQGPNYVDIDRNFCKNYIAYRVFDFLVSGSEKE